jgi:hypothetical protein
LNTTALENLLRCVVLIVCLVVIVLPVVAIVIVIVVITNIADLILITIYAAGFLLAARARRPNVFFLS